MYLKRSDEQRMLLESATRFLQSRGAGATWREIAEQGWIAAAVSERDGGLGGRAVDVMPVCEAIGAAGATLPYFSSALLPAAILGASTQFEGREMLFAAFLAGEKRIAVAHAERGLSFGDEEVMTAAHDARLTGYKRRVWDACEADLLVVSARDGSRLAWYLVDARQSGVKMQSTHSDESMRWANVELDHAQGTLLCQDAAAGQALHRAILFAVAGVLAESVGCMAALITLTQEWLATRRQFGRALAENQVLQHRCVDMFVALEESKSMLNLAAYAADEMAVDQAQPALHAAKAHVANCARFVGQQAVHLHGAMGLTEEAFVGRAYRRLEALNAIFGGADYHTWAFAQQRGESC